MEAVTLMFDSKSRLTGFFPWLRTSAEKLSRAVFPPSRDFGMPVRVRERASFFSVLKGMSGERSFFGSPTIVEMADEAASFSE